MNNINTITYATLFLVLSIIIFAYAKRFSRKGRLSKDANQLITIFILASVINILLLLLSPQKYLIGISGLLLTTQFVILILCQHISPNEAQKLLAGQRKGEKRMH